MRGCGLANFPYAPERKRAARRPNGLSCAAFEKTADDAPEEGRPRRGSLRRALWVLAVTLALLVGCHASLLLSSTPATYDERAQVARAVELIEQGGFTREAFLLRRLTS